jgi:hypothetical protein
VSSLAVSAPALAYRPFDGTDADVAETGELELEVGVAHEHRSVGQDATSLPVFVLNLGFARGFELVVDAANVVPYAPSTASPKDYFAASDLLVKAVLRRGCLQGGTGPSLATEFGALLPNPGGEVGLGASVALIASQRFFGDALTLHVNVQGSRELDGDLTLFTSLIGEGPEAWVVRPVAEALVSFQPREPPIPSLLVGVIATPAPSLALDAAARFGRFEEAMSSEVRFGLTWSYEVWTPR